MPIEIEKALAYSQRAINFDKLGNLEAAIYYYNEAVKYLDAAVIKGNYDEDKIEDWKNILLQYTDRKNTLEENLKNKKADSAQSKSQQILQRCNFLFSQALDADERGHKDISVDLYGQTAEFALTKKDECDEDVKLKLVLRAKQAIERGEEIKGIFPTKNSPSVSHVSTTSVKDYSTNDLKTSYCVKTYQKLEGSLEQSIDLCVLPPYNR